MSWYAPDPPTSRSQRLVSSVGSRLEPLRDPGVRAVVVLLGFAAVGFALFGLGWRGGARTIYVPFQVPWLMSAGVAGIAIIGTALGSLSIHIGRREAAAHQAVVEDIVRTAIELAHDVSFGRRKPSV